MVLVKHSKQQMAETNDGNPMPSKEQEEAVIKKKYGGLLPKKNPLISKVMTSFLVDLAQDHDRAFFDSADWALGKQGQKAKGPLEALRPKLQPTPQQQSRSRRSAYAPAGEGEVDGGNADVDNEEKDQETPRAD
ncbi:putative endosulphine [Helianthus annuus]|nr:putative endosulphine [Helianthus annuus]